MVEKEEGGKQEGGCRNPPASLEKKNDNKGEESNARLELVPLTRPCAPRIHPQSHIRFIVSALGLHHITFMSGCQPPLPPQRPPIMIIHSPSLVEFDFLCPLSHNSLQLSDRHANECSVCLGPLFWSISAVSGRRATLWKKQQRELLNTTSPLFGNVII